MIDINKAKEFYKEYISKYNPEDPKVALKIAHIYRTAEKAKWLATKLELEQEDILLAELIGLLHDIGRFEQIRIYNTFLDKISINHGEYGAKVLFENNLIRNFIEDKKYDEIIKKAIINHNRNKISKDCNPKELLHCKIIRDADKLDIYYVLLNDTLEAAYPTNIYPKEPISENIKKDFIEKHTIDYSNVKSCIDLLVGQIAYVFDINYTYSLQIIKKENYLEKMIKKFEPNGKCINDINALYDIADKYINDKLNEGTVK